MDNQAQMPDLANLKRVAEAAENTFAELCKSGGDELAEAWDKAELEFMGVANSTAVLALISEIQTLRKDADRYRWFRNHSLQIVHASTGPWVHDLDKVIDAAMAEADVFDVPLMCRQRMAAGGLPYPRSSCYSCGQFSPKSRECDELIAARLKEGK